MSYCIAILVLAALPYGFCGPQGLAKSTPIAGGSTTPHMGAGSTSPVGAGGHTTPAGGESTSPAGHESTVGTGTTGHTTPAEGHTTPPAGVGSSTPAGFGLTAGNESTPFAENQTTPLPGNESSPSTGAEGANTSTPGVGESTQSPVQTPPTAESNAPSPAPEGNATEAGVGAGGPQNSPAASSMPNEPFFIACQPAVAGPPGTFTCRFSTNPADLAPISKNTDSAPESGGGSSQSNDTAANATKPSGGNAAEAFVLCGKVNGTTGNFSFLEDSSGNKTKAAGEWRKVQCASSGFNALAVTADDYLNYSNGCKAKGFEVAQPTDDAHPGFNAFEVAKTIPDYYHETAPNVYTKQSFWSVDKC